MREMREHEGPRGVFAEGERRRSLIARFNRIPASKEDTSHRENSCPASRVVTLEAMMHAPQRESRAEVRMLLERMTELAQSADRGAATALS